MILIEHVEVCHILDRLTRNMCGKIYASIDYFIGIKPVSL